MTAPEGAATLAASIAAGRGCAPRCEGGGTCPCANLAGRIAALRDVARRLEAATGPDRDLDGAIAAELWYRRRRTAREVALALMGDSLIPFSTRRGSPPSVPHLTCREADARALADRRATQVTDPVPATHATTALSVCAAVVAAALAAYESEA